jgi:ferredoxin
LWLVPTVIALESADRIAGPWIRSFSQLLSSGRPVQILVRVRPHSNPGASPEEDPFQSYRTELGYLGISHRQAVVAQSSAARYVHLLQCFFAALAATRTSLHIINTGLRPFGSGVPLNAWLVAGAALESRAHPFFRINPEAGDVSAARMDFRGNPQPERDWPVHPFHYVDENETLIETELAFTFADYALLLRRLGDHFRVIPPECDSDALVPVAEYLSMNPDEAHRQVPYIWAVDGGSVLHRLAVSQELVLACRDRQNYWRALQELGGIRNRYVELAVEKTRAEEQAKAAAERARLEAEHAEEVERVRTQAAGEAMQRLADTLLGLDLSASSAMPAITAAPARERALADEAGPPSNSAPDTSCLEKEKTEPEEEAGLDEPWIDSILCTSCNDCTNLNPQLFVYNDNKQAVIADPTAGTYAQLVEAAELCPANCIHPGSPLNPDEPGLEELMERAAPYG